MSAVTEAVGLNPRGELCGLMRKISQINDLKFAQGPDGQRDLAAVRQLIESTWRKNSNSETFAAEVAYLLSCAADGCLPDFDNG